MYVGYNSVREVTDVKDQTKKECLKERERERI